MFGSINKHGVDSRDSWIIGCAGFGLWFFYFTFLNTFQVLFPVLVRQYGLSRQEAFNMFGAMLVSASLGELVVSFLAHYLSPKTLIISGVMSGFTGTLQLYFSAQNYNLLIQGVLYGIGRGCLNNQTPVLIGRHFDRRKVTAFGLFRSGLLASGIVFSFVVDWIGHQYDIHGCFLLLSGIHLHAIIFALLMKNNPRPTCNVKISSITQSSYDTQLCSEEMSTTCWQHFKTQYSVTLDTLKQPMFYLIVCSAISSFVFLNSVNLLVDVAIDKRMPSDYAFTVGIINGCSGFVSALTTGTLVREKRSLSKWTMILTQLLLAILYVSLIFVSNHIMLVLIIASIIYVATMVFVLNQTLNLEYLGCRLFARASGMSNAFACCIYFAISPLVGHYRDQVKNYDPLLAVFASMYAFCGLTWFLEPLIMRKIRTITDTQSP